MTPQNESNLQMKLGQRVWEIELELAAFLLALSALIQCLETQSHNTPLQDAVIS